MNTPQEEQQTGAQAIAAERQRQIDEEGYTTEHDEHHAVGQFVSTAVVYLGGKALGHTPWPVKRAVVESDEESVRYQRRDLVRAGALIAAAIDRLDQIKDPR